MASLHLIRAVLHAAPEVAAADDKTNLNTQLVALLDGFAHGVNHAIIQPPVLLSGKGLTAELQQDTLVFDLRQI